MSKPVSPAVLRPFIKNVQTVVVTNDTTMVEAVDQLSHANKYLDAVKAEEDKVVKPLKEALKAEQARFKPWKDQLTIAINNLRNTISEYQTKKTQEQAAKEAKIAARVEKGTLKMDTAAKKVAALQVSANVTTDSGKVTFRAVQELVIEDVSKLPIEYLVPDEKKIKAALKAGITVPGATMVEKQVPVNYR